MPIILHRNERNFNSLDGLEALITGEKQWQEEIFLGVFFEGEENVLP